MAEPESYADIKIREAEARGDKAKADYWRRIKAHVDAAPPLTQAQKDQLRILMRPEPQRQEPAAA